MVVCVEYLPADKPWDVVPAGVAPRACVRARVLVPPNLYNIDGAAPTEEEPEGS